MTARVLSTCLWPTQSALSPLSAFCHYLISLQQATESLTTCLPWMLCLTDTEYLLHRGSVLMRSCISKTVLLAFSWAGQLARAPQESPHASFHSEQRMIGKIPAQRPLSACATTSKSPTRPRCVPRRIRWTSRTDSANKERRAGHYRSEFLSRASSVCIRKYLATRTR